MTIHRRGFLTGLVGLFGVACAKDLKALVEDTGSPILLPVRDPTLRIHVYEGGCLTLGPYCTEDDIPPVKWRHQLEA